MVTQTSRLRCDDAESVDRTVRAVVLDGTGKVTERSYDYSWGVSGRTVYAYDSDGRLAETSETGSNRDGADWNFRRLYAYDDVGRLVEERHSRADGPPVRTRQPIYTADGRRIEEEQFEPRSRRTCGLGVHMGVEGSSMSFPVPARARTGCVVYDVRGAPVEMTFRNRRGLTAGKVVFETDAGGRITALRSYGESGAWCTSVAPWLRPIAPLVLWAAEWMLNGWARWNLVRAGQWRILARTLFWGPLWFEVFTRYDARGRRVEERTRFAGTLETIASWKYDTEGRLAEHTECDHTGDVTNLEEYVYQADTHGNWVHRTMSRRCLPHSREEMIETTERAIGYYD